MSVRWLALTVWLAACQLVPQSALDERLDVDGDGVPWPDDCDDDDPSRSDETLFYADADEDGYGVAATAMLACDAPEGFVADATDCDDADGSAYPGGLETCDGADNDCNGTTDDVASPPTWTLDLDGDGFGRDGTEVLQCDAPTAAYAPEGGDCDDDDPTVNPGRAETCNGRDDDCDDLIDDDDDLVTAAPLWYGDGDGDGYGDPQSPVAACLAPLGRVARGDDCDDENPAIHPGAPETDCDDPTDYNCDGFAGGADGDDDGYAACEECDDGDPLVFPGADEWCNDVDDDCDGTIDVGALDETPWYADADGDGHGDPAVTTSACVAPAGHVAPAGDCDDDDPAVHPGAAEVCNGADDDCDDDVDDADADLVGAPTWYADVDGDEWGDASTTTAACVQPGGTVAVADDCDDDVAAIHPGAPESDCNDPIDYNCDGSSGHADLDGDTYEACDDCDDVDPLRHPGADEVCDGEDDDCDGTPDDDPVAAPTWYLDDDGDGFGDPDVSVVACSRPAEHVADDTDCDDDDETVNPGAGNCGRIEIDVGDGIALTGPAGSAFGAAVALAGDVDDDGEADLIVGAPLAGADDRGTAWVFGGPFAADRVAPADAFLAIEGENQSDQAGGAVGGIPDLDGDGVPDLIVGAPTAGPGGSARGGVYVVLGGATGTLSLGDAAAERTAEATSDRAGAVVAVLRDVNGNGLPEILVGAPGWSDRGAAYVLRPPLQGNQSLASASARLGGEVDFDAAGTVVVDAGDLSGTGAAWIAVGAPGHDAGAAGAGAVYVVAGGTAGSASLGTAAGVLRGTVPGEAAGSALAALGDVDGDGRSEVLVGAPGAGGGAVYVVRGPITGTLDLSGAHAVIEGEVAGDAAGASVAAGDVTGDGLLDLVIGAPGAGGGAGAVYVWPSPVAAGVASIGGAPFRVTGGTGTLGRVVANAGDLDGDGRDDLLLGDPDTDTVFIVPGALFTY